MRRARNAELRTRLEQAHPRARQRQRRGRVVGVVRRRPVSEEEARGEPAGGEDGPEERPERERGEPLRRLIAGRRRCARELGRDRGPRRVEVEAREIGAAQARGASGEHERSERDRPRLADHRKVRAIGPEMRQVSTRWQHVVAHLDDERRVLDARMREVGGLARHRDAMAEPRELPADPSREPDRRIGGADEDALGRLLDDGDRFAHLEHGVDEREGLGIEFVGPGGRERSRGRLVRAGECAQAGAVGAVPGGFEERVRQRAIRQAGDRVEPAEPELLGRSPRAGQVRSKSVAHASIVADPGSRGAGYPQADAVDRRRRRLGLGAAGRGR